MKNFAAAVQMILAAIKSVLSSVGERLYVGVTQWMHRQGLMLSVLFYADVPIQEDQNVGTAVPPTQRLKVNRAHGRVRYKEFLFIAPSSGTAPAIADKIVWGKLPKRARFIGNMSKLYFNAGTASCTINLGDNLVAARHLAATSIAALGNAVPEAASLVSTTTGDIVIGSNQISDLRSMGGIQLGNLIVGTGIPLGSKITGVDFAAKTCTISNVATATTGDLAITVTGLNYEVSDDSNSAANAYASATDDSTLISTVAGAQVANNQVIKLIAAYVMD
jgi:hypothetical protein